MEAYRFAGYRIISFSDANKKSLRQLAERLIPHEAHILDNWVRLQTKAWEPPGFTKEKLRELFGDILRIIFSAMESRRLEECVAHLEDAGARLSAQHFPFQALVVSVHFLEQSYTPFLLSPPSDKTQVWLIAMDEFLHAVLAAIATSYFEAHRKELLEEAEVGRIVQEGLVADIPRRAVDLDVAHVYISAQEKAQLGGDFLDFFTLEQGGAAFLIGDLAGHGLEAAADSVMLRSLFRGFVRENADLAEAMRRVNRVAGSELKSGLFATALAVKYDPTGKLGLVNAGHCLPVLCENECRLLELEGNALAITSDSVYSLAEVDLKPGAVFVAYTDGLVEARNERRELFGDERVLREVAAARSAPARAIAEHLIDKSLSHSFGKFSDDVAVLVLKRREM